MLQGFGATPDPAFSRARESGTIHSLSAPPDPSLAPPAPAPSAHALHQSAEIARTAAWAVSNLARGDQTPGKPFVEAAPIIVASLRGGVSFCAAEAGAGAGAALPPRDEGLRVEAAWILAFLTAKEEETVSELLRVGMVPALVEALVDSGGQV